MTEPDVVLTDLALALQAAWFARVLGREVADAWQRASLRALFGGLALAALTGGLWHGFWTLPSPQSDRVWWLTMVFAGIAAGGYALVGLGLHRRRRMSAAFAVAVVVTGYAVAAFLHPDFRLTVLIVIPATVVFASGLWRQWSRPGAGLAMVGAVLELLAAIPQQLGVGLDAVHLSHNAVYHLLLLAAHYLLYRGLRRLLAPSLRPSG